MKWFVYNALFAVVYIALLPSFLLRMARRGGYRSRFADRFGRYPGDVRKALAALSGKAVWIHAVSVGEVAVAGQMIRSLRGRDPSLRFVFSTTSSTGWKQALREISPGDVLIYNPIDFPGCVRRALDAARPRAVILVESEIWPNFIRALKRRGIPAYLVNARVSDRSAPGYRRLRFFFGVLCLLVFWSSLFLGFGFPPALSFRSSSICFLTEGLASGLLPRSLPSVLLFFFFSEERPD